jgi:SAM-dependent methyltransferase
MHFERNAHIYERARPPYPAALWDYVGRFLRAGGNAVDLGAGTGQATGRLLEAGMRVTAIEPGAALAARLRARHPNADVVVATAEHAQLPKAAFELAVAATAVHWFDLDTVLPKLHNTLQPGGTFLVWRNVFGDRTITTPFRERVGAIVAARGESSSRKQDASDTEWWARRLSAGGYFSVTDIEHFRWSVELSAGQVHDLFATFSDWSPAEVDEAARAARELGGSVIEHYETPLIVLRRTDA